MKATILKPEDTYRSAQDFLPGDLIESRQGNQYLVMRGDMEFNVLVSFKNNRVFGMGDKFGAGRSNSYKKIPFTQILLESE